MSGKLKVNNGKLVRVKGICEEVMDDRVRYARKLVRTTNTALTQMKNQLEQLDPESEAKFPKRRPRTLSINKDLEEFENGMRIETDQMLSKMDELLDSKMYFSTRKELNRARSLAKLKEINKKIERRRQELQLNTKHSPEDPEVLVSKSLTRMNPDSSKNLLTLESGSTVLEKETSKAEVDSVVSLFRNRKENRTMALTEDLKNKLKKTEEIVDRGIQTARQLNERVEHLRKNEKRIEKSPVCDKFSTSDVTASRSLDHVSQKTVSCESMKDPNIKVCKRHDTEKVDEKYRCKKHSINRESHKENVSLIKVKRLESKKRLKEKKLKLQQLPSLHIRDGLQLQKILSIDIPPVEAKIEVRPNVAVKNICFEDGEHQNETIKAKDEPVEEKHCVCSVGGGGICENYVQFRKFLNMSENKIDPEEIDNLLLKCNFDVFDPRIDEFVENKGKFNWKHDGNENNKEHERSKKVESASTLEKATSDCEINSFIPVDSKKKFMDQNCKGTQSDSKPKVKIGNSKSVDCSLNEKPLKIQDKTKEISHNYKESAIKLEHDRLKLENALRKIFKRVDESRKYFEDRNSVFQESKEHKTKETKSKAVEPPFLNVQDPKRHNKVKGFTRKNLFADTNFWSSSNSNQLKDCKTKDPNSGMKKCPWKEESNKERSSLSDADGNHSSDSDFSEKNLLGKLANKAIVEKQRRKKIQLKATEPLLLNLGDFEKHNKVKHYTHKDIFVDSITNEIKTVKIDDMDFQDSKRETVIRKMESNLEEHFSEKSDSIDSDALEKSLLNHSSRKVDRVAIISPNKIMPSDLVNKLEGNNRNSTSTLGNIQDPKRTCGSPELSVRQLYAQNSTSHLTPKDTKPEDYESDFEIDSICDDSSQTNEKEKVPNFTEPQNQQIKSLSSSSKASSEAERNGTEVTTIHNNLYANISSTLDFETVLDRINNPENSVLTKAHCAKDSKLQSKSYFETSKSNNNNNNNNNNNYNNNHNNNNMKDSADDNFFERSMGSSSNEQTDIPNTILDLKRAAALLPNKKTIVELSPSSSASMKMVQLTNKMKMDLNEILIQSSKELSLARNNFEKIFKKRSENDTTPKSSRSCLAKTTDLGEPHLMKSRSEGSIFDKDSLEVVSSLKEILETLKCQFAKTELLADKLTENLDNCKETPKNLEEKKVQLKENSTILSPLPKINHSDLLGNDFVNNLNKSRISSKDREIKVMSFSKGSELTPMSKEENNCNISSKDLNVANINKLELYSESKADDERQFSAGEVSENEISCQNANHIKSKMLSNDSSKSLKTVHLKATNEDYEVSLSDGEMTVSCITSDTSENNKHCSEKSDEKFKLTKKAQTIFSSVLSSSSKDDAISAGEVVRIDSSLTDPGSLGSLNSDRKRKGQSSLSEESSCSEIIDRKSHRKSSRLSSSLKNSMNVACVIFMNKGSYSEGEIQREDTLESAAQLAREDESDLSLSSTSDENSL